MTAPELDFLRIEIERGIVSAWHSRSAKSVQEAHAVLAALDNALSTTGIELLLFDSRDADRTPPEVQGAIWNWLVEHRELRKVATVMHSKDLSRKVRTTAVGNGIRLKTFAELDEARRWLHEL